MRKENRTHSAVSICGVGPVLSDSKMDFTIVVCYAVYASENSAVRDYDGKDNSILGRCFIDRAPVAARRVCRPGGRSKAVVRRWIR